jgi:hypothetical protein
MMNYLRLSGSEPKTIASKLFVALLLSASAVSTGLCQGDIASGTVSGSGTGPFTYSLTFSDASNATAPIGSIWYGWVPGLFFLPSSPTSAQAPAGWTATVFGNSVQFVANSAADDIAAGQTLSGFGYHATFSPSDLAAAPNSGESVAYMGALSSDAGNTFNVVTVPEPSSAMLIISGVLGCLFLTGRNRLARRE